MPIVWTLPTGKIAITQLEDSYLARERRLEETTDQAVLRLAEEVRAKVPALRNATVSLYKTADMPTTRTNRDDWYINGTGKINTTRL